ncbi:integrase, catalytic region, zinc finger, CCHC-type containing protein [Tanacetum coccineum]
MNEKRSEAYLIPDFKALDSRNKELSEHVTTLQEQNARFRAENEKVKRHYKELYDSIKIMRAKTIEKTTSLLTEIENLKAQLKGKMKCVTVDTVKPKVLALGMYVIDVEPSPPHNRNNREIHPDYLKHLKESVETLREIVKEARYDNPLDNALHSACVYTKRFQELLEYVIGTCLKEFSKRDKKVATTPLIRKKQVTFKEPCETSTNNTQTHVKQQKVQKTNVPVIPSTGVNCFIEASGSKPRSNTKNNRILPAKSDNKKKVEDHPRNNKSNLKQKNRVDSSISSKRAQHENVSTSKTVITERLSNTARKPLTRYKRRNKQNKAISTSIPTIAETQTIDAYVKYTVVSAKQQDPNGNWGSNILNSPSSSFFKCMSYRSSFDLEVAFRKHSCYVRVIDGVELLKGSRGSNLYSISVEDMMKSSPICLLFKASKNKSWLWHRRLNHLNFGTINDLARKDLVRGLQRLKFEKDHLCSAFEGLECNGAKDLLNSQQASYYTCLNENNEGGILEDVPKVNKNATGVIIESFINDVSSDAALDETMIHDRVNGKSVNHVTQTNGEINYAVNGDVSSQLHEDLNGKDNEDDGTVKHNDDIESTTNDQLNAQIDQKVEQNEEVVPKCFNPSYGSTSAIHKPKVERRPFDDKLSESVADSSEIREHKYDDKPLNKESEPRPVIFNL